jgi:hypothetical protein
MLQLRVRTTTAAAITFPVPLPCPFFPADSLLLVRLRRLSLRVHLRTLSWAEVETSLPVSPSTSHFFPSNCAP